ncbi:DUF3574 domain-containing protein [Amycolatopsis nigrescens]|uniref:DUF3574 domain-containing protein n=1 Tax=Amycolatopsis nigrescens TaxID=381445 RepID=UPI0003A0A291|nr:DUF3574 domain-containing protein [Amycolatopsis nigrescens]
MQKSRRTVLAGAAAALVLGLGGGAAASVASAAGTPVAADPLPSTENAPPDLFQRTELFFGTGIPSGGEVTPEEFQNFVDKEVTPAFPEGLSKLTAEGQWRGASGEIVKERTYLMILLYPVSDRAKNGEIEEIRDDYKRFFDQESVLRADSVQRVSF